jgi:hypothetical protein
MSRIQPSLLVILFSFLGMLFSSLLYWNAMRSIQFPEGTEIAGYLTRVDHIVERRTSRKLLWVELAKGDPVFDGDTVRASELSGANIVLPKLGLEIHLDSSAILNLDMSKKKVVLDVLTGNVRFKGDFLENTEVHVGKEVLSLEKGAVDLQVVKEGGRSAVSVSKGTVSDSKGIIKEKTAVDLATGGSILQLEAPLTGSLLRESLVSFKWIGTASLEIAKDASFTNGEKFESTAGSRNVDLKPGRWFWRVSNDGSQSLVQSFVIDPLEPARISLPSKVVSGREVKGVWTAGNSSANFLTWSKSIDFTIDSESIPLSNSQFFLTFEHPGSYYLRTEAREGNVTSNSPPLMITVRDPSPPAQPAIQRGFGEKSQTEWKESGETLDWQGEGSRYEVLFNGQEFQSSIPHLSLAHLNLKGGSFEWKVRGVNEDGSGPWSESKILVIYDPPEITIQSSEFEIDKGEAIKLIWSQGQPKAKRVRLRLFADQEMKRKLIESEIQGDELEVSSKLLPTPSSEGELSFFALVESLNPNGIVISQSQLTAITVSFYPEAKAPMFTTPIVAEKNGTVRVEWQQSSSDFNREAYLNCGNTEKSVQVTGDYFEFIDLHPGTCELELRVRSKGGKLNASYTKVIVPSVSDLKKIKGIKLK